MSRINWWLYTEMNGKQRIKGRLAILSGINQLNKRYPKWFNHAQACLSDLLECGATDQAISQLKIIAEAIGKDPSADSLTPFTSFLIHQVSRLHKSGVWSSLVKLYQGLKTAQASDENVGLVLGTLSRFAPPKKGIRSIQPEDKELFRSIRSLFNQPRQIAKRSPLNTKLVYALVSATVAQGWVNIETPHDRRDWQNQAELFTTRLNTLSQHESIKALCKQPSHSGLQSRLRTCVFLYSVLNSLAVDQSPKGGNHFTHAYDSYRTLTKAPHDRLLHSRNQRVFHYMMDAMGRLPAQYCQGRLGMFADLLKSAKNLRLVPSREGYLRLTLKAHSHLCRIKPNKIEEIRQQFLPQLELNNEEQAWIVKNTPAQWVQTLCEQAEEVLSTGHNCAAQAKIMGQSCSSLVTYPNLKKLVQNSPYLRRLNLRVCLLQGTLYAKSSPPQFQEALTYAQRLASAASQEMQAEADYARQFFSTLVEAHHKLNEQALLSSCDSLPTVLKMMQRFDLYKGDQFSDYVLLVHRVCQSLIEKAPKAAMIIIPLIWDQRLLLPPEVANHTLLELIQTASGRGNANQVLVERLQGLKLPEKKIQEASPSFPVRQAKSGAQENLG